MTNPNSAWQFCVPKGYDRILQQVKESAFAEFAEITQPVVRHTNEYYDVLEEEPDPNETVPDEPIFDHHIQEPSQWHLVELARLKESKGKPDQKLWMPDWAQFY